MTIIVFCPRQSLIFKVIIVHQQSFQWLQSIQLNLKSFTSQRQWSYLFSWIDNVYAMKLFSIQYKLLHLLIVLRLNQSALISLFSLRLRHNLSASLGGKRALQFWRRGFYEGEVLKDNFTQASLQSSAGRWHMGTTFLCYRKNINSIFRELYNSII